MKKKSTTPINDKIYAKEVMLIGSDGKKLGLLAIDDALEEAQKKSLDLVQVSPSDAQPVVCKLLDFGKFQFEKKKSTGGTKKPKKQSRGNLWGQLPHKLPRDCFFVFFFDLCSVWQLMVGFFGPVQKKTNHTLYYLCFLRP